MRTKDITSRDNPIFKRFLRIAKARGIKKEGLALLSGPKPIEEVLRAFPRHAAGLICSSDHEPLSTALQQAHPRYRLSPDLFRLLDGFDTHAPLLLVQPEDTPRFSPAQCAHGCTLCIPFQDPVNVGAVIRSGAALGVSGIVILKEAAHPFHPKSLRGAGSTVFRIPIFQGPSIRDLHPGDLPLITLSLRGENLQEFRFPDTFCLLPGLEGPGLPETLRPYARLRIPMAPGVDS
ncbi:MAG: TrmH family RNA methyltransferase [Deltaproteobacteria bacterium]|nr:TrmH family RNA methyltransferase [Deltaproteobacteria bacterium]